MVIIILLKKFFKKKIRLEKCTVEIGTESRKRCTTTGDDQTDVDAEERPESGWRDQVTRIGGLAAADVGIPPRCAAEQQLSALLLHLRRRLLNLLLRLRHLRVHGVTDGMSDTWRWAPGMGKWFSRFENTVWPYSWRCTTLGKCPKWGKFKLAILRTYVRTSNSEITIAPESIVTWYFRPLYNNIFLWGQAQPSLGLILRWPHFVIVFWVPSNVSPMH